MIDVSNDPLPRLPRRAADSHKGDYGRTVLVGGSRGMAGSISLSGLATLRAGAGLVTLAVPEDIRATVASFEPSYMTVGLSSGHLGQLGKGAFGTLKPLVRKATAVACGPGLGRAPDVGKVVSRLYESVECPLVCDADALNALAWQSDLLHIHSGPRILTPHPGEFARLAGEASIPDLVEREGQAVDLARQWDVVIVLKGHATLVTDGRRRSTNNTGNPGMATGGSGDVLTGIITALLCQGLEPFAAARLGVHLHGLAGDLAAAELGEVSLIASDLIKFLPAAFRSFNML